MDVSACFVFVEQDASELLPQLDEIVESNDAVEVAMGHWGPSTRRALCDFAERETLRSAIIVVGHGDAARQPARMAARAVLARELVSRMALGHFTSLTFVAVNRSSEPGTRASRRCRDARRGVPPRNHSHPLRGPRR